MAYQNIPRFEPNYGNRYGFRQRVSAPSTGPANVPVAGSPSAPPSPQEITGSSSRPSSDYHSGPSAESDGGDGIDTAGYRDAASQGLGYERGIMTPGQIAGGFAGLLPGGGFFSDKITSAVDEATGFGGVPEHRRYGAEGSIGVEGGVFDAHGREVDPITGYGLNSYGSRGDFYGGQYVQGIKDNPFSVDSWLGDPQNAFNYNRSGTGAGLQAQGFQFGSQRGAFAADEELGTLPTEEERARLAQHVAVTDYGIQEHSAEAGSATNEAIQGRGYTASGAAPAGSQFSSTGTFSSSHSDDGGDHGPGGNPNSVSDNVTDDLADEDFGSYDDGGGGGGGK